MKKKVVPKLRQEVKVEVDIVTGNDIKIYYTGKIQDFTARYRINTYPDVGFLIVMESNELFITQSQLLTTLKKKSFENILGKEENVGNHHFLLFQQCFLLIP